MSRVFYCSQFKQTSRIYGADNFVVDFQALNQLFFKSSIFEYLKSVYPLYCSSKLNYQIILTVVNEDVNIFAEQVFGPADLVFHKVQVQSVVNVMSMRVVHYFPVQSVEFHVVGSLK